MNQQQSAALACWVVVPAAGIGARMQADRPKQYLSLAGRTVLEHTLAQLLRHPQVTGLVVPIAADDPYWPQLAIARDPRIRMVDGGDERCHSVLNGLQELAGHLAISDWVMVHDVARPCITGEELDRLFAAAESERTLNSCDGFVLGMPVRDTMKQINDQAEVQATPDRSCLWHAFTPQMFRLGELMGAINSCLQRGELVTDEASAMEQCGFKVKMIEGHAGNIKITRPADLPLAEFILAAQ